MLTGHPQPTFPKIHANNETNMERDVVAVFGAIPDDLELGCRRHRSRLGEAG